MQHPDDQETKINCIIKDEDSDPHNHTTTRRLHANSTLNTRWMASKDVTLLLSFRELPDVDDETPLGSRHTQVTVTPHDPAQRGYADLWAEARRRPAGALTSSASMTFTRAQRPVSPRRPPGNAPAGRDAPAPCTPQAKRWPVWERSLPATPVTTQAPNHASPSTPSPVGRQTLDYGNGRRRLRVTNASLRRNPHDPRTYQYDI